MAALVGVGVLVWSGCRSAAEYRAEADEVALGIVEDAQRLAVGETEAFSIDRPEDTLRERLLIEQDLAISSPVSLGAEYIDPVEHWPDEAYLNEVGPDAPLGVADGTLGDVVELSLTEALAVGARNSREFQSQKESVFLAALDLDLARELFRFEPAGGVEAEGIADLGFEPEEAVGFRVSPEASFQQNLENGVSVAGAIGIDLVRLLTLDEGSSLAVFGDLSVTVPLLRGSGRHIVREPLTQAERNAVYAIFDFERFKRSFVVDIASEYLGVVQALDAVENAEANYRSLIRSTRRLRRLADVDGRVPEVEVDQAKQDELLARSRWISAQQNYARALDQFRLTLGLPTDAAVLLERGEIERLGESVRRALAIDEVAEGGGEVVGGEVAASADAPVQLDAPRADEGGPYELPEDVAVRLALENRLDLRRAEGAVVDAQRGVVIAADGLRAELTLLGSASLGENRSIFAANEDDSLSLRPGDGSYNALLTLDLPFDRTEERNAYRASLIALEAQVRELQSLEDVVKFQVRERLRELLTSREDLKIQAAAVRLAERRVESTQLFLETGRAETRDLLEAQEDLIDAQDALTAALVSYRIAELELQRDMGVLRVDSEAAWTEIDPAGIDALLGGEGGGGALRGGDVMPRTIGEAGEASGFGDGFGGGARDWDGGVGGDGLTVEDAEAS